MYLNNILISGKSREKHLSALDKVLSLLEEAGLRLQEKCIFMAPEVVYLGHKIDAEGLYPLAEKVDAVHAAPASKNVAELKSYLGLLSYYGNLYPTCQLC